MTSMLDRLFDTVGGDVALDKLLVNKYRDFIGFSGESKDADAFIKQVADNAARVQKSDDYLLAAVHDLFELFKHYKGGPAALARLVEVSKPRYGHIGVNTDDKITSAIVEALQDERRTSLKTA